MESQAAIYKTLLEGKILKLKNSGSMAQLSPNGYLVNLEGKKSGYNFVNPESWEIYEKPLPSLTFDEAMYILVVQDKDIIIHTPHIVFYTALIHKSDIEKKVLLADLAERKGWRISSK